MFTLNCKGRLLVVDKPLVMGIINVTPDSFYEPSRKQSIDGILNIAEGMINDGAVILDIGGQSTRPGSEPVNEEEELNRVVPAIEAITGRFKDVVISIDTYYAGVARKAVEAGASIINDISAGSMDAGMIDTAASLKVPYVLMHMQGVPGNMQQAPHYENVTREVLDFFISKTDELRKAGINDIIIDPGFGFGKTIKHNFELLRNLNLFKMLNCPLLVGISRKSTICKTLNVTSDQALNGTTVLNTVGLMNGASILRVHDVKEAVQAVKLMFAMNEV